MRKCALNHARTQSQCIVSHTHTHARTHTHTHTEGSKKPWQWCRVVFWKRKGVLNKEEMMGFSHFLQTFWTDVSVRHLTPLYFTNTISVNITWQHKIYTSSMLFLNIVICTKQNHNIPAWLLDFYIAVKNYLKYGILNCCATGAISSRMEDNWSWFPLFLSHQIPWFFPDFFLIS